MARSNAPQEQDSLEALYVTGELNADQRAAFEAHMNVDRALAERVRVLQGFWQQLLEANPRLANPLGLHVRQAA